MSRINRPPVGLQGLLDSKNFGVNPSDLAQIVRPTVDLFPFYGTQLLRSSNVVGTQTGSGEVASITVGANPSPEANWFLLGVSMFVAAGPVAGSDNVAYVALESLVSNVGRKHIVAQSQRFTFDNTMQFGWGAKLETPLPLEQNIQISFNWAENSALTTENVQCSALYFEIAA